MDPESFLRVAHQFQLGNLETEQPHPETAGLAELAQNDLPEAIAAFHRVDLQSMKRIVDSLGPMPDLVGAMKRTLAAGGRIFFVGCGATGRLSLSLETFAREAWLAPGETDRVIGFMAGGDAALIRSIEAFEDFPEYGERQLLELGYTPKDLLVAITEGGETPFVIGACLKAANVATERPWFLFCNPPQQLKQIVERSRVVLESERVCPWYLPTGPMALAGSTRLQATTAQMLIAGAALAEALGHENAAAQVQGFAETLNKHDPAFLEPFIMAEAATYQTGGQLLYETDRYGITVLTDTTERSPTFSLSPFENRFRVTDPPSLCYLSLNRAPDPEAAWQQLLGRPPRTLEWPDLQGRADLRHLLGYDISSRAEDWRLERYPGVEITPYRVIGNGPTLEFAGGTHSLGMERQPLLLRHLLLKCSLNLQSTLVMACLGRFESNLMTRVKPSNYKLIDRAARYAQHQHRHRTGKELDYEKAVRQVFADL